MEKRNNWFVSYQSINGISGQRDLEYRKHFFDKKDFEGKNVLDIGCNLGQMCKYSSEMGATNVLGIDFDQNVIKKAWSLLTTDESSIIKYLVDDIDNNFLYTNLDKYDTTLLLSVIGTLELKNRYGMLAKLSLLTKVMYIEGHIDSKYSDLLDSLLKYTLFSRIEFKGIQFDNSRFKVNNKGRHLFRCSNEKISREHSCEIILNLIESKPNHIITIIGNGGVGKTTFKHKLIDFINVNSTKFKFDISKTQFKQNGRIVESDNKIICDNLNKLCIIDDLKLSDNDIKQFDYVIYIDYRALEYLSNVNTIFYMNYDIDERYINRPDNYKYDRSPNIKDSLLNTIQNIYNIDKY